eukprot:gene16173-17797_t
MAGTAATICCHPLDVVRTRFVAQGEPKLYRSINEAVACMVKEGGIRTFYKGLVPTLVAIFPNASFQFGFYHLLKLSWQRYQGVSENQLGKVPKLLCGAMSGIISKLLLIPFDVVKKRLQIQGFEGARQQFGKVRVYNGMANCFVRIVADEGVAGLFKGSSASVLKTLASIVPYTTCVLLILGSTIPYTYQCPTDPLLHSCVCVPEFFRFSVDVLSKLRGGILNMTFENCRQLKLLTMSFQNVSAMRSRKLSSIGLSFGCSRIALIDDDLL